jgi:tetratricopeptide (TPR) repeat protein
MKLIRIAVYLISITFCYGAAGNEANRPFYDGVRAEAAGDLDAAITSYEKAVAISHSANLHGNLANLHYKMGASGKAILHYRKALLLDPGNPELNSNLAFTRKSSGLSSATPSADDFYFAPESISIWIWATTIAFWLGAYTCLLLTGSFISGFAKIAGVICWAVIVAFGTYAIWRADRNIDFIAREAVAVLPPKADEGNETSVIRLRRYAGGANDANAELKPGEVVRIDKDENGQLKMHITKDQVKWYLARSVSGGKKGWATAEELQRILQ